MDLRINKIIVGPIETNCYIVSFENGDTLIVDPGDEAERIIGELRKIDSLNLKYILLTHGHFDHLLGVDGIKKEFPNTKAYIGEKDIELVENMAGQSEIWGEELPKLRTGLIGLGDNDEVDFGSSKIKIIETPGHTIGSVCYLLDKILFSGDTLFYRTYGRLDLPHSAPQEMGNSLKKLLSLSEETKVLPGHMRETTIAEEKSINHFF